MKPRSHRHQQLRPSPGSYWRLAPTALILSTLFLSGGLATAGNIELPKTFPGSWRTFGRTEITTGADWVRIANGSVANLDQSGDYTMSFRARAVDEKAPVQIWGAVRVRDRENLRFERTRLFGRVRRIFVEMGRRLFSEGALRDPRDVFYLTLDEILGFVEGTSTCEDLQSLSQLRRRQFERYRELPAPAERFETRGAVFVGNRFESVAAPAPADLSGQLRGIGCCPGVVRGPVRVVSDPRRAQLRPGEILVAERTDPGWIMLFPAAAGVLVERGSLLSHSAIVAREMGIPAIVSIAKLTQSLADGQWVEMNGSTGVVTRITGPAQVGS